MFRLRLQDHSGLMQIGVRQAAEKVLSEFGPRAEAQCDARAFHYAMLGDAAVAEGWRRVKEHLPALRAQSQTLRAALPH
jgi:hypothetical protein